MADDHENQSAKWLSVIGKSLAFLCLAQAELRDKGLATQAQFLEGLGLSRSEAANMLGTTPASLGVMLSRVRGKKRTGGANAGKRG